MSALSPSPWVADPKHRVWSAPGNLETLVATVQHPADAAAIAQLPALIAATAELHVYLVQERESLLEACTLTGDPDDLEPGADKRRYRDITLRLLELTAVLRRADPAWVPEVPR